MSEVSFRRAAPSDLSILVRLLADDPLGAEREEFTDPLPPSYARAFERIEADPNQQLLVAELGGAVVGMLQLTLIPYLTYRGGVRALIEGVRVHRAYRGRSIGRALFEEAIRRAREADCHVVQLTTDKKRPDALAFYEALGFRATHEGMKLHLAE